MVEGLRRVVVTGLGAVTPIGNDVASTWAAMLAGTSGVSDSQKSPCSISFNRSRR